MRKHSARIIEIQAFINKYNIFHQQKMILEKLEKNNATIALNVLC